MQQRQHSSHLTRQQTPKSCEGVGVAAARQFLVQLSSPVWLAQPTQGGMAPGAAKTRAVGGCQQRGVLASKRKRSLCDRFAEVFALISLKLRHHFAEPPPSTAA